MRRDGGRQGEGRQQLPSRFKRQLDSAWKRIVTAQIGFINDDDMRAHWKMERAERNHITLSTNNEHK